MGQNDAILQIRISKKLRADFHECLERDGYEASELLRESIQLYVEARKQMSAEDRAIVDPMVAAVIRIVKRLSSSD